MRRDTRSIDVGVRDVVAVLNRIHGVTTRASCEGGTEQAARHRHAHLAYVLLRHPMPLSLQDFLVEHIGEVARIEDAAVYSRWPTHNREFRARLEAAARAYIRHVQTADQRYLRWPLAKLRARLARQISGGRPVRLELCLVCVQPVTDAHPEAHVPISLLHMAPDQQDRWFAEFVAQPGNALDPALIASDGWVRLTARTHRGDFGPAFQRRWLRFRSRQVACLTTGGLRAGVESARRQGADIDFFYNETHAVFGWTASRG